MTGYVIVVEDRGVQKFICMYPEYWEVVDEVNDRLGLRNMSAAMRYIVHEYRRMNSMNVDPRIVPEVETAQ